MSMQGKYCVITAQTPLAQQTHRELTDLALKSIPCPAALHEELEDQSVNIVGREVPHDTDDDGEKKKKKSDGTEQGNGSGGSKSGGSGGGASKKETREEDPTDIESLALLLYRAGHELEAHCHQGSNTAAPLAAATLLFNRSEQTAHLHTPFMHGDINGPGGPNQYLLAFEQHAAVIGANVMFVRAHPSATGIYKSLGYEIAGPVVIENGMPVQAMRKIIGYHPPSEAPI